MHFETATVTGATGHIGNVLVRELVRRGKHVRALVVPGDDTRPLAGQAVELVEGDVTRPETLDAAMRGSECVFHLAGIVTISARPSPLVAAVNVGGTRNVLDACRRAGVRRVVYTSSVHALAEPRSDGTLDETAPFDPLAAAGEYGRAKAAASLAAVDAAHAGLDTVLVLPTAVVGPYDYRLSEMGELMALFARHRLPAITEGGYAFVDVRDVARAHVLAAERGRRGESYLVNGGWLSVRDLLRVIADAAGRPPPRVVLPRWAVLPVAHLAPAWERLTGRRALLTPYSLHTVSARYRVNDRKARHELGFSSMPLEQSLRDAWIWMTTDPESPLRRSAGRGTFVTGAAAGRRTARP